MIVLLQMERNPTESWQGHFQVASLDDILLKGSAFKTYDMNLVQTDGYFDIRFHHAVNEYPKLRITNRVTWLSQEELDKVFVLEAGTPLLDAVAQKMLGEGHG